MLLFRGTTVLERAGAALQCLKGYNACGQGLPANFCCSPDSTCIILASNTTALCCPAGQSCNAITPTTCNVGLMNVTSHPDSPILTTALDSDLPSCGNSTCCPFGYECATPSGAAPRCVMGKNQATYTSLVPKQTKAALSTISKSTTSIASTAATATTKSTTAATLSSVTTATTTHATARPETEGAASRSTGVIAGSVIAAVAVFVGLGIYFWARRRKLAKNSVSRPAFVPPAPYQQYRPPAYDIAKADTMKGPHANPPRFCGTLTTSPAYVPVVSFAELDGTKTSDRHPLPETCNAQAPVELPASPVSFSMWERQEDSKRSFRQSIKAFCNPPQAAFVPWSRFAAGKRQGHREDGGNWI